MTIKELENILEEVKNGQKSVNSALESLKNFPYSDLGFARIDHHREIRTGYPEIVYCAGKTVDQVREIFRVMSEHENNIFGTRADEKMYKAVKSILPETKFYREARIISLKKKSLKYLTQK